MGGHHGRGGLHWWSFAIGVMSASLGQTDYLSRHGGLSIYWPLVVSLACPAG